jgi:hypothetical protein
VAALLKVVTSILLRPLSCYQWSTGGPVIVSVLVVNNYVAIQDKPEVKTPNFIYILKELNSVHQGLASCE